MKERPILFSTPMVQAILQGRKTQTRRIVKNQCEHTLLDNYGLCRHCDHGTGYYLCKYGKQGDVLWVRETWLSDERGSIDGKSECIYYKADLPDPNVWNGFWKPSIFMPKRISRIRLEIISVRAERLCDITEEDAIAEGIEKKEGIYDHVNGGINREPSDVYAELWDKINGTGSWIKNPWVWVIQFKKL
jgi:hypothetical protein